MVIFPPGGSLKRSSQHREEEEEEDALVVAHFAAASARFGISVSCCSCRCDSCPFGAVLQRQALKKTGNKEVEKSLFWTKKKGVARGGGGVGGG